jgi:hypothetical protein
MGVGLVMFIIFGSFFEMVFSFGRRGLGQWIFPVALIGVGIYLVLARSGLLFGRNQNVIDQPDNSPKDQP